MKLIVIVSVTLLMFAVGLANAQQIRGQLQLYADETGVDCIIQDVPGLVKVYVYYFDYFSDEGVTAVQFGAPVPSCWTGAIWLEDSTPWLDLGDSQLNDSGGWMIAFGGCQIPPVFVGTIWYFAQGLAQTCCPYPVVKAPGDVHPEIPAPLGVDCSPNPRLIGINPGTSYINGDHTCPCIWPVPVQEKTWGGIKSLYR
jgi:hypothetical protein